MDENQLRSPTKIGHLSLSDSSTDDYLYVQSVPLKEITANPAETSSTDLTKLKVGGAVYNIPSGSGGSVAIAVSDWSSNTATKTFTNLGNADLIEFYPATIADKTNASNADIFVTANGNIVTFTATTTPAVSITFNYFITRGRA